MNSLKRKSSPIWNHFTPIDNVKAKCDICRQVLSYKSTTATLKKHIERKHPTVQVINQSQQRLSASNSRPTTTTTNELSTLDMEVVEVETQEASSSSTSQVQVQPPQQITLKRLHLQEKQGQSTVMEFLHWKLSVKQQKIIDDAIVKMVYKDFQPFSIVENVGFEQFTAIHIESKLWNSWSEDAERVIAQHTLRSNITHSERKPEGSWECMP